MIDDWNFWALRFSRHLGSPSEESNSGRTVRPEARASVPTRVHIGRQPEGFRSVQRRTAGLKAYWGADRCSTICWAETAFFDLVRSIAPGATGCNTKLSV